MADRFLLEINRRYALRLGVGSALIAATGSATAFAQAAPVKLGFIGSGREGGALGTLFAKAGHQVLFSSRHPEQLADLIANAGPNAKAGTVEEAVAFADVIALVVPYTAVEQIGKDFGPAIASKRLLLDVSNPIPRRDGEEFVQKINAMGGAGLATAKFIPGAKIVRGFNAIGFAKLAPNAAKTEAKLGIPIAGDDPGALQLASQLITEIGFVPVVVGGLAMGKYLVPGTPLGGEYSPDEIKQILATLKT